MDPREGHCFTYPAVQVVPLEKHTDVMVPSSKEIQSMVYLAYTSITVHLMATSYQ